MHKTVFHIFMFFVYCLIGSQLAHFSIGKFLEISNSSIRNSIFYLILISG